MKHSRINHNTKNRSSQGFTLIEIIVATVLIAIVLPIITTIVISIMRQQLYISRFAEVKRQGDLIANAIRSKLSTESIVLCANNNQVLPSSVNIIETVHHITQGPCNGASYAEYSLTNNILSQNGVPLSNGKVNIATSPVITVIRMSASSRPIVDVTFTIRAAGVAGVMEKIPSLTYSTKIIVKE